MLFKPSYYEQELVDFETFKKHMNKKTQEHMPQTYGDLAKKHKKKGKSEYRL